ncbi:hypothetical protein BBJ29_002670 [Phytophthora kernoviae]|uniref:Uncharacterized protein n=1 Tax=Phytophthora kernoviae TaxID=325452 RepID=A0A3F2RUU7_9STRA|nr:hypothetical protein BBJ29_002670 [Phytophthora kernoviae]RLN64618.1 hypothetical protein BBP00_00003348 [Phytophthora kernoviae]
MQGLEDGSGLLCDNVDPMRVLDALLVVTETVHGRMLIEEQGGEEASLLDTTRLMDDLATHHESVFDDRCEIFPLSIQMLVMHRAGSTNQDLLTTTLIDDEVAALEQQKSALVAKIATAKQRIQELGGPEATSEIQANLPADPTTLSRELGCRLAEALILIESCQQVAESVSPALHGQTDATELAATSTSPAEDVEQCQTELQ